MSINRTLEFPDGVPVADTENMTKGNSATLYVLGEGQNDLSDGSQPQPRPALPCTPVPAMIADCSRPSWC